MPTPQETPKNRLPAAAALALLAVLPLGLFSSVLDGTLLLTERDLSIFFIPPRLLWVEAVTDGALPLWNPYSLSGTPLLATLQPGVFYPVNLLLLVLPFDLAFNWTIILHFSLAGVFSYLLARELGGSVLAGFISGCVYMLSGYLFSVHNVMSTLFTAAWVPLAVLLFSRSLGRGSFGYALLTGLTLSVMLLGGGVEVLAGTVMLMALLVIFSGVTRFLLPGPGTVKFTRRAALGCLAVAVMLGLTAVQVLPFLELAGLSTRGWGLPYSEATTWSFGWVDFVSMVLPDPYGNAITDEKYWANQSWLKTVYVGPATLMLAAFFFRENGRRSLGFALTGLGFLLLAMGSANPLYRYLHEHLPFFSSMRYPVKFTFVPFLFLAVAGGLGIDSLRRVAGGGGSTPATAFALVTISTLSAVALALIHFLEPAVTDALVSRGFDAPEYNRVEINVFNAKRLLFFTTVAALAAYFALVGRRAGRTGPVLVAAILAIDLFFAHQGFYNTTPAREYHAPGEVMTFLKKEPAIFRFLTTPVTMKESVEVPAEGPFEPAVIKKMDLDKERVRGYNIEHRLFDAGGFSVIRRADYGAFRDIIFTRPAPDSTNLISLMNVRYVVSIPEINSPEYTLVDVVGVGEGSEAEVEGEKVVKVYRNEKALARFFTVREHRLANGPEVYMDTLPSRKFDPAKVVLLEKEPRPVPEAANPGGEADTVKVIDYSMNSATLDVSCGEPCVLVASESFYPGWKAYVDGEEREILKADYVYRAVALDGGAHRVRFSYEPASFSRGLLISAVTAWAVVIAGIMVAARRRER